MSASVNLPLHHKAQKFSSGTGSSGWSRKKGRKMVTITLSSGVSECALSMTKLMNMNRLTIVSLDIFLRLKKECMVNKAYQKTQY